MFDAGLDASRLRPRVAVVMAILAVLGLAAMVPAWASRSPKPVLDAIAEEPIDQAIFFADPPVRGESETVRALENNELDSAHAERARDASDRAQGAESVSTEPVSTEPVSTESAWTPLMGSEYTLVATVSAEGREHIDIYDAPASDGAVAWQLSTTTEFDGPRVFRVIGETQDWVQVSVPVRPNGSVGWIPKSGTQFSSTTLAMTIDLSDRQVIVTDGETVVFQATGAVGQDRYATPVGEFYIRDSFAWDPTSVYGPYVMALSAFSEHIDEINGGEAVIALHGTNRPGRLGQAVSLGCVRLSNDDITTLAHLVPLGTPVTVIE